MDGVVCFKNQNPDIGLQLLLIKPPRPDSACARPDTPPIHCVAGGEITPPEPAEFQNKNENEKKFTCLFITSFLHPLLIRIIYRLPISNKSRCFAIWKFKN
jgi:hypothetical protein